MLSFLLWYRNLLVEGLFLGVACIRFPILPILLILLMLLLILQKLCRLSIDAIRMAVFGIVCEDDDVSNLSVVIFRLSRSSCSNSKLRRRSLLLALDVVSMADHRAFLEESVVIVASCRRLQLVFNEKM